MLLAPLVVARKGLYTDLAKWAHAKGFKQLRVDGALLPTTKWPRLDRFKEHTIELPVQTLMVSAREERALRAAVARALEFGKGVLHVLPGASFPASAAKPAALEKSPRRTLRHTEAAARAISSAAAAQSPGRGLSPRKAASAISADPATAPSIAF